ncbi:DUF6573 family protein [Nocardia salmonicida]|uniref:DUF6573 family protein n=1 Tax=Nocardia salmonicida TaxID=53431 RepID=UPI0037B678D1
MFEKAAVVNAYARAQSIEDGFLFDVTEPARVEGFTLPVALGFQAHRDAISHDEDEAAYPARITAVLSAAREAIRDWPVVAYRGEFQIDRAEGDNEPDLLTLTAHIGPGDEGEPVVTIMRPADE